MTNQMVYVGIRLSGGKKYCRWVEIADGMVVPVDGAKSYMFAAVGKKTTLNGRARIGEIWNLEEMEDGKTVRVVDRVAASSHVGPEIREWQLAERAALAIIESDKILSADQYSKMTLQECREAYSKAIGFTRQQAVLAAFLRYVTG